MPRGYKLSDKPSRYRPLIDHLAAATGDAVVLTYRQVAALVGPLPESVVHGTAWWTSKERTQVAAWRALGWRAHASPSKLRVRFTRDAGEVSNE